MSESEEYVWRSRQGKIHVDKECVGITSRDINVKRMRKSVAEAWNLEKCTKCCGGERERVGHSKWSDFVNNARGKRVSNN
jgi:hypothetical protein